MAGVRLRETQAEGMLAQHCSGAQVGVGSQYSVEVVVVGRAVVDEGVVEVEGGMVEESEVDSAVEAAVVVSVVEAATSGVEVALASVVVSVVEDIVSVVEVPLVVDEGVVEVEEGMVEETEEDATVEAVVVAVSRDDPVEVAEVTDAVDDIDSDVDDPKEASSELKV
jgi:hypothetical protein